MPERATYPPLREPIPTFMVHQDGDQRWITVDYWPDHLEISADLVDRHPAALGITRDADEVTIKVANGEATYRIVACDDHDVYHTVAVRRQWAGPHKTAVCPFRGMFGVRCSKCID